MSFKGTISMENNFLYLRASLKQRSFAFNMPFILNRFTEAWNCQRPQGKLLSWSCNSLSMDFYPLLYFYIILQPFLFM